MDDLLTTHQVQNILKVDRITIYRMLTDGRIRGVKVGQQWRFTRQEVERILKGEPVEEAAAPAGESIFPVHCVQTIQDLFSDVGQIGALLLDEQGEAVTKISRPCAFCSAIQANPAGLAACQDSWRDFATKSRQGSRFFTCHAGLQYIGAPVMDRDDRPVGLFLAGPFYWETPAARENAERLRRLAAVHNLAVETLQKEAGAIPVIDPAQHARLETWPLTAARAVQSIMRERLGYMSRLQQIANLTQLI